MAVINVEEQKLDQSLYVFQEPYFYDLDQCKENVVNNIDTIFSHLYVNYGPSAKPQQIYCVEASKLQELMSAQKENFKKKDE